MKPYRIISSVFFTSLLLSQTAVACKTQAIEQEAEKQIQSIYQKLQKHRELSMPARIAWISQQFLGKPYLINPLGEGINGKYDQCPRFRSNAFDCLTFVTTVTAMALSDNFSVFQSCLANVRYKNGQFNYLERNHFTSLDWNKINQKKGFIEDYTLQIKDKSQQPVAVFARAEIDKAHWYQKKATNTIRLQQPNLAIEKQRLAELKQETKNIPARTAKIAYIPFERLFDANGNANQAIFSQIPDGAIIEIVRPNWDLTQLIGSHLHVSHLGFAIKKNERIYFREASSIENKVIDIPLIQYLQQARKSPTIKGINIQVISIKKPFAKNCTGK